MKKYVKKQFEDGETYIEAIPAGYPDWWDEFKKIVNNSFSLNELFLKLMEFEHYSNVPRIINGQIVFNPLVYDFLINNQESLKTFNKGHEKGKKDFKKNYFKKYPNEEQAKTIFTLYNNRFKETILRGDGFFNDSNIMTLGYSNGILTGYWQFENDHLTEFEMYLQNECKNDEKQTGRPKAQRETAKQLLTDKIINKEKFLTGLKDKFGEVRPREFVYMIKQLTELDYIKENDRVVYYEAFEDYFETTFAKEKRKNQVWTENVDIHLMKKIKTNIILIKDESKK